MAKVYPGEANSGCSRFLSSKRESFTIWMKSLVLSGKGCTVFDSDGNVVFRVDNYDGRHRDVYLMDFKGEVLFTILRKEKFKVFRVWEGYRATDAKRAGFVVRQSLRTRSLACEVNNGDHCLIYNFITSQSGSKADYWACKIVDKLGRPIAEVKRKQSECGVPLGEDVLTMVVEPCVDHCLVMGLFVVYSLINSRM